MVSSLRHLLKTVREKVDGGYPADALKIIESELKLGTVDYMLFLLAGYVNFTLRDLPAAVKYYRLAIDLDRSQPRAWLGLFNVYNDAQWCDFTDDFPLTVVDRLLRDSPAPEKVIVYEAARLRFLVELRNYIVLEREWDGFIAQRIDGRTAAKLLGKMGLAANNEVEHRLAEKLIDHIRMADCVDESEHFDVCLAAKRFRGFGKFVPWYIDHMRKFSDCLHECIGQTLLGQLQERFTQLDDDDENEELLDICASLPVRYFRRHADFCVSALTLLRKRNHNGVYELLVGADAPQFDDNGDVVGLAFAVALHVYRRLGRFDRVATMMDGCWSTAAGANFLHLKAEADFIVAENVDDHRALLRQVEAMGRVGFHPPASIRCASVLSAILSDQVRNDDELDVRLAGVFGDDNKATDKSGDAIAQFVRHFCRATLYHRLATDEDGNGAGEIKASLESARDELRSATQLVDPFIGTMSEFRSIRRICNTTALGVRILLARCQHQPAIAQLVSAAQHEPYNAQNFRLLAECLLITGVLEKAQLCAERSQLLNPRSELTVRLLMRIYERTEPDNADKLTKGVAALLDQRPNSRWALRQAALLDLNAGRFEAAIDRLQRLIRLVTVAAVADNSEEADRREICTLWIYLSETYRQCGNLQSAVRASRSVVELFPDNVSALLQLLQLYQSMSQYAAALEVGETLLRMVDDGSVDAPLAGYVRLLFVHSLSLHITDDKLLVGEQREPLARLFKMLRDLLAGCNGQSVLLQKIVARALDVMLSYNSSYFATCVADFRLADDDVWRIASRADAVNRKLECLSRILRERLESANTWNDMAETFMVQFELTQDTKALDRCAACVTRALGQTHSKFKIAGLYRTLGRAQVLRGNARLAQHCFIRAIQLDRHNAEAWSLLGLLYLKCGLLDEAYLALNEAQKIDPESMVAWCGQAMHAEATDDFDTMDLYRHAIFLQPTALAVKKYGHFLTQYIRQRRQHEEGAMLDFAIIRDLSYKCEPDNDLRLAMALLAEQFGYFENAKSWMADVSDCDLPGVRRGAIRIAIKNLEPDVLKRVSCDAPLDALATLYSMPNARLFLTLRQEPTMMRLFDAIEKQDVVAFIAVYRSQFYSLIAAASIVFGLAISQELFAVVENVRPLHRLVDVYPQTGICRSELFTFQQQNEEEKILVRHDHLSDRLYDVLSATMPQQKPLKK